jgi:parallel beta-helix repeat protein
MSSRCGYNTIENNVITCDTSSGIYVLHEYDDIINNTLTGCRRLDLAECSNTNAIGNTIDGNCMILFMCNYCVVTDNTISNSGYGIADQYGSHNTIAYNEISGMSVDGINLWEYSWGHVNNYEVYKFNTITDCAVGIEIGSHNEQNSIDNNTITNCPTGILLQESDANEVTGNLVTGSDEYGILLTGSNYNNLCNNTALFNNYGINPTLSLHNVLWLNRLVGNGIDGSATNDLSYVNSWNSAAPLTYTYGGYDFTGYAGN